MPKRIGFCVPEDADHNTEIGFDPVANDHAVYGTPDHVVINMKAGELNGEHLGKLLDLEYEDGTGERVRLVKITHYLNKPGARDRGASEYEDNEPLTQLVIDRNGDTRATVYRQTDRLDVRMK